MTYAALLERPEWIAKRDEIIDRDGHNCTSCGIPEPTIDGAALGNPFNPNKVWLFPKKEWELRLKEIFLLYPRQYSYNAELDKCIGYAISSIQNYAHLLKHNADSVYVENHFGWHLQVHHKYYLDSFPEPWAYEDDALITLCCFCHLKEHKYNEIPLYHLKGEKLVLKEHLTPCPKCEGIGVLPEYDYYKHGVCFGCQGNRFMEFIP